MPEDKHTAEKWTIYVLKHPVTGEVRYVGKTSKTLDWRLSVHIGESKHKQNTHKQKGIRMLLDAGMSPAIEAIEFGHGKGWQEAERKWISHYKETGIKLWNGTDGGEGSLNWGTPEERSERSKKAAQKRTPEDRAIYLRPARKALKEFFARMTAEEKSAYASRASAVAHNGSSTQKRVESLKRKHASRTKEEWAAIREKAWETLTPEQREESIRRLNAGLSREKRSELGRMAGTSHTPEQLMAISRRMKSIAENMTPEERILRSRRASAGMTTEQRREFAKNQWANRTPEQKSAIAQKISETRSKKNKQQSAT